MIVPDDDLDAEFPLGDGTAATSAEVYCPYCGEVNFLALDPGSGPEQRYTEDCQVCCRPWQVRVRYDRQGGAEVSADPEDSA
jgi:transposase-like protein